MDKSKLDKPLYCQSCGEEFLVKRFRSQLPRIIDYCILEGLKQELQLLIKVESMYSEYPEAIDRMVPSIFLGDNPAPTSDEIKTWTKGNESLINYLLKGKFNLKARKNYVEKSIKENVDPIRCPKCNNGIVCFKEGRLREFEPKLS